MNSTARVAWQDIAKGIGIVLVVIGHVERGLVSSGIADESSWSLFDFALYTFHMPLFMFLAGMNVPGSLAKGRGRFARSKVLTVAWPYVLWCLLQGGVSVILGSMTNNPLPVSALFEIYYRPISPFWFLYALFVFSMIAAFVPRKFLLPLAFGAFMLGEIFGVDSLAHQLLHFGIFYVGGMLLGSMPSLSAISTRDAVLSLLVASATIAVALVLGFENYNSVMMLPAAMGGIVVILWLSQRITSAALVMLGEMSMAIYVMHITVGSGARIALQKVLGVPEIPMVYLVVCTALATLIPVAAWMILHRLGLTGWFGLGLGPKGQAWVDAGSPRLPEKKPAPRPTRAA